MEILTETNIPKNKLKTTLELYLNPTQIEEINEVLDFAENSHKDQKRISGEPYIIHPIATAQNLAEMKLDTTTIKGALLHDVIEDCNVFIKL